MLFILYFIRADRRIYELGAHFTFEAVWLIVITGLTIDCCRMIETSDESIRRCLVELEINRNMQQALEHEEFIANLTRKVWFGVLLTGNSLPNNVCLMCLKWNWRGLDLENFAIGKFFWHKAHFRSISDLQREDAFEWEMNPFLEDPFIRAHADLLTFMRFSRTSVWRKTLNE